MKKPHIVSPFGCYLDPVWESNKQVSIFIDYLSIGTPEYNNSEYRILISGCEPPEIYNNFYNEQNVIDFHHKFDLILTSSEKVVQNCNNAVLFPFGSGWVEPITDQEKIFQLSFLAGVKNQLVGHRLRQEILKIENQITNIPTKFFQSYDGKKDDILYPSMFSIIVENTQHKNYFTEKIIDCLLSKNIPIYWGCPNIPDYFDKRGFITFNSIPELIAKCNMLTPEVYESKKEIIEKNFNEALIYKDYSKRVSLEIQKHIDK
jgi:hypothetical protein